jgi:hypothetical protein
MAKVLPKRVAAEIEGDFVVFLIGMRINKFWKPWKWLRELLRRRPPKPDAGPVLALVRAPRGLCAEQGRGALARLGHLQ